MGKRVRRVPVTIDSGDIKDLPKAEIIVILRAADEIVGQGGRSLLVKILKGSRDKKVLEHELDKCPAYGMFKALSPEEIGHKIDWLIENGFLRIEYDYRLPFLYFADRGWEIERKPILARCMRNSAEPPRMEMFRQLRNSGTGPTGRSRNALLH
jgi:superfamily II DNA helicase RecQ